MYTMSAKYFQQSVPNKSTNIRSDDIICDNSLATNDLTINQYLFKKTLTLNQQTNATNSVNANYKPNLNINTQTFTTPHSNNNVTSFLITSYDCSLATDNVNVSIQRYNGTTGLPIVVGKCLDNNQYQVSIINLHQNQDLNGTFRLSVELSYSV